MAKRNESFPGYPHLMKVCHSERYGRMELLSVERTSDGYLTGYAKIGTGKNAYTHSVFLGRDPRAA
jgi:hypothetical protein